MKSFFKIFAILLGLLVIAGTSQTYAQSKETAKTTSKKKSSDIQEIKIKTAFHCAGGKASIEETLKKEEGVQTVVADLETKIVTVTYDAGKTDKDKIITAIENTGFRTEFTPEGKEIKRKCTHEGSPDQH